MRTEIIGRKREYEKLENCIEEGTAQLVIVNGRRRVGKTFLIDSFFQKHYAFQITGVQDFTMEESLATFAKQLGRYSKSSSPILNDWQDAFWGLADYLDTCATDEKLVVFFDEMPWLAEPASAFIKAFETFWGNWAERHDNLVFIACGSVTSWMTEKVFHNRGGLYRRCTCKLDLMPLRLYEVEELLQSKGMFLPRQDIARGYMILGGIPEYWKLLDKKISLFQNIDTLFFSESGSMRYEILELYQVLSSHSDDYMQVVEKLSQKRSGLTQEEIAKKVSLTGPHDLAKILNDLTLSGFVRKSYFFGRNIESPVYQLADFYTAFYFHFIHNRPAFPDYWSLSAHSPGREAWEGLTFERLCLDHVAQIKQALQIKVFTGEYTWSTLGDPSRNIRGAQVDLVLDRDDNVINLCEIKFWNDVHTIARDMEETLKRKMDSFQAMTGTKKALQITMITPYGVKAGTDSIISNQVTLDDLFQW